jgi:Zn-dependent peptidase ImmA (M78 family)
MFDFADKLVNRENHRNMFFDTKKRADALLFKHNNVDFLLKPTVGVDAIAIEAGIIRIIPVSKDEIPGKHATLKDGIIKLSNEDDDKERRFSTGHELYHHIKAKADKERKETEYNNIVSFLGELGKKNVLDIRRKEQIMSVARSGYDGLVQELKRFPYLTKIIKPITKRASDRFGKRISEDKAYNSIAELIRTENTLDDNFIDEAADHLYNEEIADYFSANLLVPIERFVLWDDRPNNEIAAAFQVPIACIEKRKKEVALELKYLAE